MNWTPKEDADANPWTKHKVPGDADWGDEEDAPWKKDPAVIKVGNVYIIPIV